MTSLYKVTDETDVKYNSFLQGAFQNSQKLGQSVSNLVEQTAQWAKLGYNIDEASKLAQTSSVYSNVGEVDNATAVSDMVTAMKAYEISSDNAMSIIDSMNELGNNYAVSSAGLGEGLKNAASALALGGTNINKSLALLTGGGEITQNIGELGNMLKVGQMRVMSMKGALEELGEEYEDLDSVTGMQTKILNLTNGQVNIMNDADPTKFKDYYDILEGVAKVYKDLDQTKRMDLTELLFGKMRGNQGAAVLQAFMSGQVQKALETAQNSAGSAMEEQDRWMQSIEAKQQRLTASAEEFSNTFLSSSLVKGSVDGLNSIISGLTSVTKLLGTIPTLATVALGAMGAKGYGITGMLSSLKGKDILGGMSKETYISGLQKALQGGKIAVSEFNQSLSSNELKKFSILVRRGSKSIDDFDSYVNKSSQGLKGFSSAFGATAKTMAINMGAMLAITATIKLITWVADKAITTFAEQKEKVDNLTTSFNDLNTELATLKSKDYSELTSSEKERLKYLERVVALKEKELALENRKLADKEITSDGNVFGNGITAQASSAKAKTMQIAGNSDFQIQQLDNVRNKIDELDKSSLHYNNTLGRLSTQETDIMNKLGYQVGQLDELELKYLEWANKIQEHLDLGVYDNDQETKAQMQALVDDYNTAADEIEKRKIKIALEIGDKDFVYTSEAYKKVEKDLEELAKQGKLTADTLADNEYAELNALMQLFGITLEDLIGKLNGVASESDTVLSPLTSAIDEYKIAIEELPSKLSELEEVQDKVNDGYSFSYDEIEKLKEQYPELENAIYRTADGWGN